MTASLYKYWRQGHAKLRDVEHVYMVLVALVIGLGGGLAAVGFRKLIGLGNTIGWFESEYTLDLLRAIPFWWKIPVPAIGGLLCALIVYYFAREAKGHGVPEVMEAVALRNGRIRPRVVLAKMLASAISIASGGSVGREGPIVQIGSALGSSIGQWLKIDERRLRTLVGCGAAAGIAGTFNAPVAGALFAVEIILADFGVMQFSPIVISSVAATVVGHHFFGDVPAFMVPQYDLVHYNELFGYAVLGIFAGVAALAFVRILYFTEDLFDAVKVWPPLKAVVGGAIIGVIALWYPQVFGVGYEAIDEALAGKMVWHLLLILVAAKIVAVSITIGSGGSGGIFAPSLFIGAMAGGAVGTVIHSIWPESTAGPGAYALVGMAAVVGATTHAPITAIVIIFELTADYKIMLPLMISTIIATLLATRFQKGSIYTIKLLRRGVDIHKGQDVSVLKHLLVRDGMRSETVTVRPGAGLMDVIATLIEHPGTSIFVVDEHHRLRGVITASQGRPVLTDPTSFAAFIIAQDMMQESGFPTVSPRDTLADVMKRLAHYRGEVPVVENGRLVGAIWPEDVIQRYNAELFKRDMASGMASAVSQGRRAEPIPAMENTSLTEISVPARFVGQSLGSLNIRNRYEATILLIKQKSGAGEELVNAVPSANYVFQAGDVMLVMGPDHQLRRLERGDMEITG
ncbi:MAG: chloride channel protein [Phycisphaerae bacterium]|nr:chloride channel protein [Phycisphaerae bacterium]